MASSEVLNFLTVVCIAFYFVMTLYYISEVYKAVAIKKSFVKTVDHAWDVALYSSAMFSLYFEHAIILIGTMAVVSVIRIIVLAFGIGSKKIKI